MCWQRGYTMEQALYGIYTNVDFSVVCGQKDGSNVFRSPLTLDTALVQLTELTKAATTTFSTEFSASLHRRFFFLWHSEHLRVSKWTKMDRKNKNIHPQMCRVCDLYYGGREAKCKSFTN